MGRAYADYRRRLRHWLSWVLHSAAMGPFIVYLILAALANLLDDEIDE